MTAFDLVTTLTRSGWTDTQAGSGAPVLPLVFAHPVDVSLLVSIDHPSEYLRDVDGAPRYRLLADGEEVLGTDDAADIVDALREIM
jgi:hypothetical protein